uniref:Phosphatidylinositol transfer protein alpha isoform n=1 Tax=Castor canadensis TaxID=51338 RepID=A0A8B7U6Z0_CASCN|nr:phosphatidylinositol transfer protein alpha isoform isoform X3 [Castor canadensis]
MSKVPTFVRMLAPEGALNIHEKAWNAYPYCRTVITNEYMKEDFLIKIETWHKPDLGTQENVHKLEPETWKHVEAIYIDIADRSQVLSKDYKAEEDPAKFKSIKTGRGPLGPNWKVQFIPLPPGGRALCGWAFPQGEGMAGARLRDCLSFFLLVTSLPPGMFLMQQELVNQKDCPYMCAYKLVTVKFKWWGLQNKVENFIHKQEKRLFTNFHRQLFCWLDKWVDLTMDDIRRMEEETKRQLDEMRQKDPVKGMTADD